MSFEDHLIASASHDLKTPLATIRLLAHLIERDANQGTVDIAQLEQRIRLIESTVDKMASLIGELQDVARLHGGRTIELHLAPTDLVAVARRVADSFELSETRQHITVKADVPQLIGRWDTDRVERVLTNLVANGLKYSPAGGRVTIHVSSERDGGSDYALLAVHDSGRGIPAADMPHIFDWFHRGGNVADTSGSGVGLASAKFLVEAHGGTIDLGSRVGQGTTVSIRLPVETAPERRIVVPVEDATPAAEEQSSADLR